MAAVLAVCAVAPVERDAPTDSAPVSRVSLESEDALPEDDGVAFEAVSDAISETVA